MDDCAYDSDCATGYVCDQSSGECFVPPESNDACRAPSDCPPSYTCGEKGYCMPGDCYFNGCVSGFECDSSSGIWECVPSSDGAAPPPGDAGASGNAGASGHAGGSANAGGAGNAGASGDAGASGHAGASGNEGESQAGTGGVVEAAGQTG